jgi:hypothetical protein
MHRRKRRKVTLSKTRKERQTRGRKMDKQYTMRYKREGEAEEGEKNG